MQVERCGGDAKCDLTFLLIELSSVIAGITRKPITVKPLSTFLIESCKVTAHILCEVTTRATSVFVKYMLDIMKTKVFLAFSELSNTAPVIIPFL